MPCFHPLTAWQKEPGDKLIFERPEWGATMRGGAYQQLQVKCEQCAGCRLARSRHWATRCMHEGQMHKHNCMITLTYNDQNLNPELNLQYRDWQLFIRRLRKLCTAASRAEARGRFHGPAAHLLGRETRFYMGGEYGPTTGRPHFHAILFGIDFADRTYHAKTKAGEKLYTSPTLDKLWGKGFASIGNLTFESAAYIARYIMKKRTGDGNKTDYEILNPETGEIHTRKKEFNNMSRRPGVGSTWISKYKNDVYPEGKVIIRGHKNNAPRYYDKQHKKIDELAHEDTEYARYLEALAQAEHHTPERLLVQEQVQAAKTRALKRNTF